MRSFRTLSSLSGLSLDVTVAAPMIKGANSSFTLSLFTRSSFFTWRTHAYAHAHETPTKRTHAYAYAYKTTKISSKTTKIWHQKVTFNVDHSFKSQRVMFLRKDDPSWLYWMTNLWDCAMFCFLKILQIKVQSWNYARRFVPCPPSGELLTDNQEKKTIPASLLCFEMTASLL